MPALLCYTWFHYFACNPWIYHNGLESSSIVFSFLKRLLWCHMTAILFYVIRMHVLQSHPDLGIILLIEVEVSQWHWYGCLDVSNSLLKLEMVFLVLWSANQLGEKPMAWFTPNAQCTLFWFFLLNVWFHPTRKGKKQKFKLKCAGTTRKLFCFKKNKN